MRKFYYLAVALFSIAELKAQCTPQDLISEGFESYTAGTGEPMADCWSIITDGADGVRNKVGDANTGNNYAFIYTMFNWNSVSYIITPEISSIDGEHYAEFYLKASRDDVTIEYGTMTDNTDASTFVSIGSQAITQDYEKITTPNVAPTAGHKYFAIKLTAPTFHTALYLDDFEWKKETTMGVFDANNQNNFRYYPNPVRDYLNIDSDKGIEKVEIYDVNGRLIYHSVFNKRNVQINIQELSSGVYIVNTVMNGKTKQFKMIKK